MALEFGIFDHVDRHDQPLKDFYEDRLKLIEAYDRAGIYGYHCAEHHSTPLGMAPSPSVYLAAVGQRTKRLRFGPLVYTLALYHPLRLAEEICMLDQMSRGRFLLGIGKGISPIEVGYYGVDFKNADKMFAESFAIIMQALTTKRVDFEGEFFRYKNVPFEVECFQKPHPPLWYGVVNPDSAERAAKAGMNFISNSTAAMVKAKVARYSAAHKPTAGKPAPKFGMNRYMVLAETEEKALEIGRRAYRRWWQSFMPLWLKHNTAPNNVNYPPEIDGQIADGRAIATTPAKALEHPARRSLRNPARTIWSAASPSATCRCRNRRARWSCSSATSCRRCARACRSRRNKAHDTIAPQIPALDGGHRRGARRVPRSPRRKAWPSQPLRWVVGFPPGGSGDIVARIMAAWLAERLGQPVVIENKPGASTNISIQTVVNAPADGNTLLFIAASAALNVSLFDNLPFNLQRDIVPVSAIIDFPLVLLANPSLPAKTVPGADRLRQGQPRQDQHRVVRHRHDVPCRRRAVQDDGRHRHDPRALSRRRADDDGPDRRPGAGRVRRADRRAVAYQVRRRPRARHGRRHAIRGPAGCPDDRRDDAAVRRELLVRHRRAARHAARDRRAAQPRDQRRAEGPRDQEAARRARHHADVFHAG